MKIQDVLISIDFIGTFVFAITGASIGGKSNFDFFGMLFLAFLTAIGGGTIRDLIIGEPVFWTTEPTYLYLIFLAALSIFFLMKIYERWARLLFFLDTLGVATFVVIGTHKTLELGFNSETALIMGTISAVLGGILRSAFSKEYSILYKKELYATVAAAASLLFIILRKSGLSLDLSIPIVIALTLTFRYLAVRFKIQLPTI
ncbi:MAG: trimeric intracellular cation channel family protein [Bdellovibrionota bacterium]|nr:trimeric intracellular cation channel family protein [Bdellovibrionota bacterium]